jgi:ribonucleoside-diphosphate reductase alpha chain
MCDDFYWLNKESRLFLDRGYIEEGKTAEERIREIAIAAELRLGIDGFAEKFYNYMAKGFFSLATPVWCNYGNSRGLPVSCFGSYISDKMDSILYKNAEVGMMSKFGGGTSAYFGELRHRGAPISVGGTSSGSVHFMELFDKVADTVSQGSSRRGSFAAYLPVDHPDIMEFLRIRSDGHPIQNMSFAVTISDEWMKDMIDGNKEKRKIWARIIEKRFESGYPYVTFIDNINKSNPKVYNDKNLRVKAQNLCVTGDQRVVSNKGLLTAKQLYELGSETPTYRLRRTILREDDLVLFDNNKSVKSTPMLLIEKDADVYEIELENGLTHKVTSYHKVKIRTSDTLEVKVTTADVACSDLSVGDLVAVQTNKGLFGDKNYEDEAFLLGLYQADGTQDRDNIMLDIWEQDFDLIPEIEEKFYNLYRKYDGDKFIDFSRMKIKEHNPKFKEVDVGLGSVAKKRMSSPFLKRCLNFAKGSVPDWIWESDEKTHWAYIKGLFLADGTVNITKSRGGPAYLSISNISTSFLKEIQLLLLNLGLQFSIHKGAKAGMRKLPDGKGGSKYYACKECLRLVCGNKNDILLFEENTGFLSRKNKHIEPRAYRDNTKKFHKIKSIKYVGKEDVYCVTVDSEEHHWICNGIVTHNCNEITLHSDEENSFVCVLSSLNLLHWDEIKNTDAVETLIYFLESVNEEFVQKTSNISFMKHAHNFAKNHRALGLGVLGWHSYLQSKNIAFESMEAGYENNTIFKTISERCERATKDLALLFGETDLLKGYGVRNTHTMAIAPTTSSSFILGQISPSIEPLNSNYFVKRLAKGNFTYKNPHLKKLLKQKNKDTSEVWKSILIHGGSVQHLEFLSDHEKNVFKTFSEISQKQVIIQAAQRQKYIDQGQSLNIMIDPTTKAKYVSDLMIFAWEQGIKGLYYQRGANPSQKLSREILNCVSCEG